MSRLIFPICFILVVGLVLTVPNLYGWNKATHMAIGAMAYRQLKTDAPQTLAKVVTLLRQHPYFQTQWAAQLVPLNLSEDEQNEYLFMLAARWPDDIKGKDAYHDHFSWHFIDYLYAPQQGIARSDTALPTGETILQAYEQNRQLLMSAAPDSSKAVALCWLFHLAGDIHQPLHTSALVDPQFPQGDQGGNLFKIKVLMSSNTINLHSFWDGMLLGADDFRSVDNLAVQLRHDFTADQLPQLSNAGIVAWSKESFQLARDNVYRSNTLKPGSPTEGTVLPPDYEATVKPIAQRQVALAGYRLTNELVTDLSN